MQHLIDSFYNYNDWANAKVLKLAEGLGDEQLDQPKPMGFGSLRATLFHILAADTLWLERWQGKPWRKFPTDPEGASLAAITAGLKTIAAQRAELIEAERVGNWSRIVDYRDSKQTPYQHRLRDLLLHVLNHGIHHRAQALSFLKQFDRRAAGGIDYIFFRLAHGPLEQSPEAKSTLRGFGLSANDTQEPGVDWNAELLARQFEYSDWAVATLLNIAQNLDDEALDRNFDLGQGTMRKILLHMFDVESWWTANWTQGSGPFPHSPAAMSIAELSERWRAVAATRNQYLASLDHHAAQQVIEVSFGGPPLHFQIVDTASQLALHGTHHRAQVVNLLRQVDSPSKNIDLLYALAELS